VFSKHGQVNDVRRKEMSSNQASSSVFVECLRIKWIRASSNQVNSSFSVERLRIK